MQKIDFVAEAQSVFEKELNAIIKTKQCLDKNFNQIATLIYECNGKVILTGMGKPGHIGTKIAATFASLGIPAFFMHPGEAMHGDLGMVERQDIVILMSYSGESTEITALLPILSEIGCATVAITGKDHSTLANGCAYKFVFPQFDEACYMHLAPTSSTTALLVLGDALALAVSKAKNYTERDFGFHHPAGSLGKRLLVKVKDLMHSDKKNAVVLEGCSLRNAIVEMSAKGLCMVSIVDNNGCLKGLITDGDLRRMLEKNVDVYTETVDNVMTRSPLAVDSRDMAVNALQYMNDKHITCMPVLDESNVVVGAILMQDILKAGIIQ